MPPARWSRGCCGSPIANARARHRSRGNSRNRCDPTRGEGCVLRAPLPGAFPAAVFHPAHELSLDASPRSHSVTLLRTM
ncbi:hypothetical protein BGLA2_650024 [Burkholderia gladioli]|nr:hypothetical protein BGLA2_650024 [Burkholderia gladioli]